MAIKDKFGGNIFGPERALADRYDLVGEKSDNLGGRLDLQQLWKDKRHYIKLGSGIEARIQLFYRVLLRSIFIRSDIMAVFLGRIRHSRISCTLPPTQYGFSIPRPSFVTMDLKSLFISKHSFMYLTSPWYWAPLLPVQQPES